MSYQAIFERLWKTYTSQNPQARRIHDLLTAEGEQVVNDHVAFRTFNDPRVGIEQLAKPFLAEGYVECGSYHFEQKKLFAKHYELKGDDKAPKVFISELLLEEFSDSLQAIVSRCIDSLPQELLDSGELLYSGVLWPAVSYQNYLEVLDESEYAAWMLAYGYCANHFTVSVNHLEKYNTLEKLNAFLAQAGYQMNASGGVIKGTPEQLLEQSSTLAEKLPVSFSNGTYEIPACYYEFARRYAMDDGQLYTGFIAASADKIFESTDVAQQ